MLRVMLVPALGAIVLTNMLYFAPSRARARENPRIPNFWEDSVEQLRRRGGWIPMTYCCGVIGLAKVTVDTTCARSIDNAAILLFQKVRPSSPGDFESTP